MATLLALGTVAVHASLVVVVSAQSAISTLEKDDILDIYMGKKHTFPNGVQAIPIEQPSESDAHADFHKQVTGKNPNQVRAYWSRQVFSGKGSPPKIVPHAEVKMIVKANPNTLGYIDKKEVDTSLRIVFEP